MKIKVTLELDINAVRLKNDTGESSVDPATIPDGVAEVTDKVRTNLSWASNYTFYKGICVTCDIGNIDIDGYPTPKT